MNNDNVWNFLKNLLLKTGDFNGDIRFVRDYINGTRIFMDNDGNVGCLTLLECHLDVIIKEKIVELFPSQITLKKLEQLNKNELFLMPVYDVRILEANKAVLENL